MLYKSLQKLRREDGGNGPGPSFASSYVRQRDRKRLMRAGALALGMVFATVLLGWFVRGQLASYVEVEMPTQNGMQVRHSVDQSVSRQSQQAQGERAAANQNPKAGGASSTEARNQQQGKQSEPGACQGDDAAFQPTLAAVEPAPVETQPSSKTAEQTAGKAGEMASGGKGPESGQLDAHFSRQAERNRRVLAVSRELKEALRRKDTEGIAAGLDSLRELLPQDSVLVWKWEGVLALQTGDPERAVNRFRGVVERSPNDRQARVNLALALLRQGRTQQARDLVRRLYAQNPDAPMVGRLARRLKIGQ